MIEKGVIKRFFPDRHFGFIGRLGAPDVFFHGSQVTVAEEGQTIQVGALVSFNVQSTERGLRAVDVEVV